MNALFTILWGIDLVMFGVAAESTLSNGVGGMVLFASEVSLPLVVQLMIHSCYFKYAILMASALNSMTRYIIEIIDLRMAQLRGGENAPPWENKSMYIFYIELVTGNFICHLLLLCQLKLLL